MIRIDIHYITRCLSVHACMPVRPTVCLSIFNFVCFIFKLFLNRDINLIYHLNTNPFALIFTAQQYTKMDGSSATPITSFEPRHVISSNVAF